MTPSAEAGRLRVRLASAIVPTPMDPAISCAAPSSGNVRLAALMASPPFVGQAELLRCRGSLEHGCEYAIAIPVRDEERRLPAALDALAKAMRTVPRAGCVVFVINDTTDSSAEVIEQWSQRERVSTLVVEVAFAAAIRNAPHARRLALDIAARAVPQGALFTSDADTRVGEAWIDRGLQAIAAGKDLVCEDVLLDEEELAALPARVREVGDAERAYFELCDLLWRFWTYEGAGRIAAHCELRGTRRQPDRDRLVLFQAIEDFASAAMRKGRSFPRPFQICSV